MDLFKYLLLPLLLLFAACGTNERKATETNDTVMLQNSGNLTLSGQIEPNTDQNDTNTTPSVGVAIHSAVKLQQGERLPLYLTMSYPDGHTQIVKNGVFYSSENPQIATVDDKGTVTAVAPGTTTIHAVYNGYEAVVQVHVVPPSSPLPTELTITLPDDTLPIYRQLSLEATLTLSDGTTIVPAPVTWQSETPTICTIDAYGKLQTLTPGLCQVRASYGTLQAQTSLQVVEPTSKERFTCSATRQSEEAFTDTFTTRAHADVNYPTELIFADLSVEAIEKLFNTAHEADPTLDTPMVLPPQEVWDEYDASHKVLYLVNAERCARGLRPIEGIDPTLRDRVTKPYAEFISTHEADYLQNPHTADGKTPAERMADVGIVLGQNSEYYGENIAMIGISTSDEQPIYEAEAKSVYGWLYQDKNESYGHRAFILHTGYHDDSGESGVEGLIAAYTEHIGYQDIEGNHWRKSYTVMDGFDPTAAWDDNLSTTIRVPLYRYGHF